MTNRTLVRFGKCEVRKWIVKIHRVINYEINEAYGTENSWVTFQKNSNEVLIINEFLREISYFQRSISVTLIIYRPFILMPVSQISSQCVFFWSEHVHLYNLCLSSRVNYIYIYILKSYGTFECFHSLSYLIISHYDMR